MSGKGPTMEEKRPVLRETDAEAVRLARTLLRTARHAALAVLDPSTGAPMASRVGMATDQDGAPLLLVSQLSAHTGALLADPRASLLLGEPGKGDPLAHPRLTLACRAAELAAGTDARSRAARRFLNRNPKARLYADLPDFRYFRLGPLEGSLVGGFGKAYRLGPAELLAAVPAGLDAAEQGAIEHINADHADAVTVYAQAFAGKPAGPWTLTGIDAEGLDLAAGDDLARVWFPEPLDGAAALRRTLVELAAEGRRALSAAR